MKELTQKLDFIFSTSILDVDLSWLNNNYQRALTDNCVRETLFKQVEKEELATQISQWKEWTRTKSSHLFLAVTERFNYLRQFSPAFLEHLELR